MTRSAETRRRALGPDEQALWSTTMADVKPLRRLKAPRPPVAVAPSAEPAPRARRVAAAPATPAVVARAPGASIKSAAAPSSVAGALGIDKKTLARLKRGDIPVDGRLDLHGMTQADAHDALDRFIDAGGLRGARLMLVITGKGVGGDGVLRRMLPSWLRSGPHAARILRIEPAHAKHGASGAWYVYLRRRREAAG